MVESWTLDGSQGLNPPSLTNSRMGKQSWPHRWWNFLWTLNPGPWVRLQHSFQLPGNIRILGKQTAEHHTPNPPENRAVWFQKGSGKPARRSCTFFDVSAAARVFWGALWEVTAGTWLLCFESASFMAAQTEIKGKQHHYLAGFSVWFQQRFSLF